MFARYLTSLCCPVLSVASRISYLTSLASSRAFMNSNPGLATYSYRDFSRLISVLIGQLSVTDESMYILISSCKLLQSSLPRNSVI